MRSFAIQFLPRLPQTQSGLPPLQKREAVIIRLSGDVEVCVANLSSMGMSAGNAKRCHSWAVRERLVALMGKCVGGMGHIPSLTLTGRGLGNPYLLLTMHAFYPNLPCHVSEYNQRDTNNARNRSKQQSRT